jgi:hypothetical protein
MLVPATSYHRPLCLEMAIFAPTRLADRDDHDHHISNGWVHLVNFLNLIFCSLKYRLCAV